MIFKSGPIRILLGVGLLLFASCGSNAPDEMPANEAGNGKYGGIFRMNFGDGYKSLYPLGATELGSMQILWNVMEGLVAFRGGSPVPEPCLAESWDVLDEATRYVFHIRRGVHFQDDACFPDGKGREVVAQDVAYCLRRLCEADKYNESFWLVDGLIKGAREYHQSTEAADGKVADVEGIKVIDDYTLEIDLTKPFSGLPYLLTSQYTLIYPREAVEKYGIAHLDQKAVGTGPFRVKDVKPGMYVALARNEHYWRKDAEGNALPYLDGIMIGLDKQLNEAAAIRNGKLDLGRNMNMEMAEQFHSHETNGRFRLFQVSTLSSTYLTFLHSYKPFQDERVRKAIALAIDKERIAKHLTNGQQPAKHGVVPPYFEAYETKYVDGIGYDPDEAKRLLAEAGYPGGKGFPEFEFICSERHKAFGLAIQEMLAENLNVSVNVTLLSFQDLVKRAFSGTAPMSRASWIADYPDPRTFLSVFYSTNIEDMSSATASANISRYINPAFDKLMDEADKMLDLKKRMELFQRADEMLMRDAAVVPIAYGSKFGVLNNQVRNFEENRLQVFYFGEVYFGPEDE